MLNAIQGVDVLVDGLDRGIAAAVESFRADRELAQAQEANSSAAWERYARTLLSHNYLLQTHLQEVRGRFRELADTLVAERNGYQDYVAELLFKIQKLTTNLERQTANMHAFTKMRDRLIEQLAEISDPQKTPLLKPEVMQAQLRDDWEDFMQNSVIPHRKPLPIRAAVPRKGPAIPAAQAVADPKAGQAPA